MGESLHYHVDVIAFANDVHSHHAGKVLIS